jgi:hypothetical protein
VQRIFNYFKMPLQPVLTTTYRQFDLKSSPSNHLTASTLKIEEEARGNRTGLPHRKVFGDPAHSSLTIEYLRLDGDPGQKRQACFGPKNATRKIN